MEGKCLLSPPPRPPQILSLATALLAVPRVRMKCYHKLGESLACFFGFLIWRGMRSVFRQILYIQSTPITR